jgi:hypothetical protein
MAYEFDTTVLGGLPVTIEFDTTGYDNRDCGGGIDDVDDWSIVAVGGKTCKRSPHWITNKLTSDDESRIIEECYEHKGGW